MLCYNVDANSLGLIYLSNQSISIVSHDKHLGNHIVTGIHDRNILTNVCDLYQGINSVIAVFYACDSELLDSLHLGIHRTTQINPEDSNYHLHQLEWHHHTCQD